MTKEFTKGYVIHSTGIVERISKTYTNSNGVTVTLKNKVMKPFRDKSGYLYVDINGNRESVHRIVATAFIDNPDGKRTVNHKDGNKSNNDVSNLEWMTHSENHLHAWRVLGRKSYIKGKMGRSAKRVEIVSVTGKAIQSFESAKIASLSLGVHMNSVSKSIREGYTIKGHKLRYK